MTSVKSVTPSFQDSCMQTFPVPQPIRRFIVDSYGVNPEAAIYFTHQEPSKVFLVHDGCFQFVDFASAPSSYTASAATVKREPLVEAQPLTTRCFCLHGFPLENGAVRKKGVRNQGSRRERFLNSVSNYYEGRNVARGWASALDKFSSEWRKLCDSERVSVQKERRKAIAFKTALCRSFKVAGICDYGEQCCFAHGENELRLPPEAHPKYKTQLCNKFSVSGYCPYGSRCQFIHQKPNEAVILGITRKGALSAIPRECAEGSAIFRSLRRKNMSDIAANKPVKANFSSHSGLLKRSTLVTSNGAVRNTHFTSFDAMGNKKRFVPDLLPGHSTTLVSRLRKGRNATAGRQKCSKNTCNMFDELFAGNADVSFSKSCFPRLSLDNDWLTSVKTG